MGEADNRKMIADLLKQAVRGDLKVPIDASFALSDAASAHQRAEERGRIGRVIMLP
ncbi:zinc-binding dehydrogenase [Alcaligenes aquatilis]|uniref:zinc-binding dehydrogenase n=1 Tax=Alcaligenes aquatilis TaxID=323284 RepID=UPI003D25AD5C